MIFSIRDEIADFLAKAQSNQKITFVDIFYCPPARIGRDGDVIFSLSYALMAFRISIFCDYMRKHKCLIIYLLWGVDLGGMVHLPFLLDDRNNR